MATDLHLYLLQPGDQGFSQQPPVGRFSIGSIECSGRTVGSMRCLSIDFEAHGPASALSFNDERGGEHPLTVSWLDLAVTIATNSTPRRNVGRVHIDQKGMLPLAAGVSDRASWTWEVAPEDIEMVEQARSLQPSAIGDDRTLSRAPRRSRRP